MGNIEEKKEHLKKFLNIIGCSNLNLNNGFIDKVEVYKKNYKWNIYINYEQVLEIEILKKILISIKNKFPSINVELFINYQADIEINQITQYYDWFIQTFIDSPTIVEILNKSEKTIRNNEITIYLSQIDYNLLKKKRIDYLLIELYRKFFGKKIDTFFIPQRISEEIEQFKQKVEQENYMHIQQSLSNGNYNSKNNLSSDNEQIIIGENLLQIAESIKPLVKIMEEEKNVLIKGKVISIDIRELKNGKKLYSYIVTDYTDSIIIKYFVKSDEEKKISLIKVNSWLLIRGNVQFDTYNNELTLIANEINLYFEEERLDDAENKRIELHAHTTMSTMDGIVSAKDLIKQAAKWGHSAIAITDHGVAQAFPEAYETGINNNIKVIYGLEAFVYEDQIPIIYKQENIQQDFLLDELTYVVFDTETTGLSSVYNHIIEIGAVKIKSGKIIERYSTFVNPDQTLSFKITELTGISNEMIKDAPKIDQILPEFKDFIGEAIIVAHNAKFDMGFINIGLKKIGMEEINNPIIDTVELARLLYPGLKNYKLNTLTEKFNIPLLQHHRAVNDAEATALLFIKMLSDLKLKNILTIEQFGKLSPEKDYKRVRPFHLTILVLNEIGLKNLYRLISISHLQYFHRVPRIPKSKLIEFRDGLLFGTACSRGELFEAMISKTPDEIENIAMFYDYFEIQPLAHYHNLIENEVLRDTDEIKDIHIRIIKLAQKLDKMVVATGDVHMLHPWEHNLRKILNYSQNNNTGYHSSNEILPAYFYTTNEMLLEFSYLGDEVAKKIVIDNPNYIANLVTPLKPFPDELHAPIIEGSEEEIKILSFKNAKERYGDELPEIVQLRLEKELNSIINNGFSVVYLIAQRLVKKSLEDGYLVGSRGSVGSSFVATMLNITEVNPLPPHYVCPNCKRSEFFTDGTVNSGYDLSEKKCDVCGVIMDRDGQDIPFETFMGFNGDKVPDIDLNFSGDYQPRAHKYIEELFGKDYVFRAGTISTVADKTAFGFVMKYQEEHGMKIRSAEIMRLAQGITGCKRTTGQHPGGLMVIPQYKDVYDFTPIQHPADDVKSNIITTHFDYHAISGRLLKLDILGHDDPTVIRMLQDLSNVNPKRIPITDKKVMKLFSSTESLGVTPEQIGSNVGTYGIPEFGTKFVRQMLEETKPTTFAELVQISGLSHGTDVWLNNAHDLILNNTAPLSEVISTRDDIMVYLIYKGLNPLSAFKIMERVRKGKGLGNEEIKEMKEHNVPNWYIESCQKIKYMFPKAHAVAYVLMALRIAYFKVYYPIYFYATYFSVRADDFDLEIILKGSIAVKTKINEITLKGLAASPKEKSLLTILEVALEMLERGYSFKNVDLYLSDEKNFIVDGKYLIPPFSAIQGIGINAANNIVSARKNGEFLSLEDLQERSKISKPVLELLERYGILSNLPQTNQLSLF